MLRAIGFVIMLTGLWWFFSDSFSAFDSALTATFQAVEAAAVQAQKSIE